MICRSVKTNPDDLKNSVKISIPRYVLCGQGKDEHYEYEIKVSCMWSLFYEILSFSFACLLIFTFMLSCMLCVFSWERYAVFKKKKFAFLQYTPCTSM